MKFRRRRLAYHLVMRCRRRRGIRPPRLRVSARQSPTLTSIVDGGGGASTSTKQIHHKCTTPAPSSRVPYQPSGTINEGLLTAFCEKTNFLSVVRLMKTFDSSNHAEAAKSTISRMNLLANSMHKLNKCSNTNGYMDVPLIYDTGASHGLTPFRADFIDYHECDIPVKDISKVNRVRGIGTVMYKMIATNGDVLFVPGIAYHLPTADIRLFSPQTYHQLHGGSSEIDGDRTIIHLQQRGNSNIRHDIEIPIDKDGTNLPVIYNVSCTNKEKKDIGHHFRSAMSIQDRYLGNIGTGKWSTSVDEFDYEFGTVAQVMMYNGVGNDDNINLTRAQKELLLWHWRLGISMHRVQELMRGHMSVDQHGEKVWMPAVITPKFGSSSSCAVPKCTSCELARAKKRNPQVVKQEALKEKAAILAWDKYQPGDFISMDQFVVKTPGRLEGGYGREGANNRYHGGTIFNDAASGIIWVENQVSLGAGETIMAKETFEQ